MQAKASQSRLPLAVRRVVGQASNLEPIPAAVFTFEEGGRVHAHVEHSRFGVPARLHVPQVLDGGTAIAGEFGLGFGATPSPA